MKFVLDACAMIAYLRGERGAEVVGDLLAVPDNDCFAHAINLCEVYYDFVRSADEPTARQAINDLLADGIVERRNLGRRFWQRAGSVKARGGISLADCFCIALAQETDGELITSDHQEFDPLVPLGLCRIRFIRRRRSSATPNVACDESDHERRLRSPREQ